MTSHDDPLGTPFATLCMALRGLQAQTTALATVHTAVGEFNEVFGRFQNAMALHASCLAFPVPKQPLPRSRLTATTSPILSVARPSFIPKPQVAVQSSSSSSPGVASAVGTAKPARKSAGTPGTNSRHSAKTKGKSKIKRTPRARMHHAAGPKKVERSDTAPWKWDKNLRDSIPRKYQSESELRKLENILMYLKNRHGGITIADLVTHSGLAVIRCKEILQTLTKLELVSRRQEQAGFIYTFGSED